MDEFRKSLAYIVVAFFAACIGLLVAVVDVAVVEGSKPPRVGFVPDREWEEEQNRETTHFCITFFSMTYAAGALIYRWRGDSEAAQTLHRWSSWHMLILHILGSGVLVFGGWLAWKRFAVIRPSLLVVVILVAMSAWDAVRNRKSQNPRET